MILRGNAWQGQRTSRCENLRCALYDFVGVKYVGSQFSSCQHHQQDSDERRLQQENEEVAFIIFEQFHIARAEEKKLLPGIAAPRFLDLLDLLTFRLSMPIGADHICRYILDWLGDVLLIVFRE